MQKKNRLLSPLLCSALLLCACAQHKQHQKPDHSTPDQTKLYPTTLGTTKDRRTTDRVSVIEFDSNGTYWNTRQLHQALGRIRATPKPLLITFVHGWRHNARPDDADLQQFSDFIDKLSANKSSLGGYTPVGLYIGWRGASINEHPKSLSWLTTLPAIFSFWNIKHGTDRVALRGDLGHALSQTSAAAWKPRNDKSAGKCVMIGHSFGGRILEMVSSNQASVQTGDLAKFKPLADLIVLINPASESLNARQTKLALEGWQRDYPLIIAVGAKNDFPNARAWPLGYFLARQPRTRDYHIPVSNKQVIEKQRTFLQTTVANDQRQITHLLDKPGAEDSAALGYLSPEKAFAANLKKPADNEKRTIWLRNSEDATRAHPFVFTHRNPNTVQGVDYVYESKAYWVFQVPESVLSGHGGDRKKGHGGVLSPSMTDLMAALFASASLEDNRVLTPQETVPKPGDSPKAVITLQGQTTL